MEISVRHRRSLEVSPVGFFGGIEGAKMVSFPMVGKASLEFSPASSDPGRESGFFTGGHAVTYVLPACAIAQIANSVVSNVAVYVVNFPRPFSVYHGPHNSMGFERMAKYVSGFVSPHRLVGVVQRKFARKTNVPRGNSSFFGKVLRGALLPPKQASIWVANQEVV